MSTERVVGIHVGHGPAASSPTSDAPPSARVRGRHRSGFSPAGPFSWLISKILPSRAGGRAVRLELPAARPEPFPLAWKERLRPDDHAPHRSSLVVRRLCGGDMPSLCAHLKRLDPASRRQRFGCSVNDGFIELYGACAIARDTLVLGCFIDDALRGIAELKWLGTVEREAELAVSVEGAFQDRGLGSLLVALLLDEARRSGTARVLLHYLRSNLRIRQIAARHDAYLAAGEAAVFAEFDRPRSRRSFCSEDDFACALIKVKTSFFGAMLLPVRSSRRSFMTRPV